MDKEYVHPITNRGAKMSKSLVGTSLNGERNLPPTPLIDI